MAKVVVSGGFDPIHVGHLRMIKEASKFGDVIVVLNTDEWLVRKKGYAFMSWEDRAEILNSIKYVSEVVKAEDEDGTVWRNLRTIKPDYFANGGDRTLETTPELQVCEDFGIEPLFGVGGEDKYDSSSALVRRANMLSKKPVKCQYEHKQ